MEITRRHLLLGTIFALLLEFFPKRKPELPGKLTWNEFLRVCDRVQERHYAEMVKRGEVVKFTRWNDSPGAPIVSRRST